jgi:hypothetical protein
VAKGPAAAKTGSRKDTSMAAAQLLDSICPCPALDTVAVAAYPPIGPSHPVSNGDGGGRRSGTEIEDREDETCPSAICRWRTTTTCRWVR